MATYGSLAVVLALVSPMAPADQPVASYACRADAKFGRPTVSLKQAVDARAPATVPANTRFTVAVNLRPGTLPSEVKGFKLKEVRDLTLRLPVPPNSSYVDASVTGGSGLNSTPTVRLDGTTVIVTVAGPIPGGASYQLPTLSLRLKAGRAGTAIETRLKGTSYDDPGLTLQAKIKWKFITTTAPVACYPDPNPALTRTAVGQSALPVL
jgi:dehydratase